MPLASFNTTEYDSSDNLVVAYFCDPPCSILLSLWLSGGVVVCCCL